jgi:spermidine synthase
MTIPIDVSERAGVRYLHFGSEWIQGAMRIARPWALELDYTREMMAGLLLRPDAHWPRSVLVIGLGAASLTKFLYRHRPNARLTVVEIAPEVVHAARTFFKLPDESRQLRIEIADGAFYVANSDRQFDLILLDAFDPDARAGALDTLPFYRLCRTRLSAQGLLSVNLLGRSRGYRASAARVNEAFDGRSLAFPSCDSGNAVVFAAAGDSIRASLAELKEEAIRLKSETGLNLLPTLSRLAQWQHCAGGYLEI